MGVGEGRCGETGRLVTALMYIISHQVQTCHISLAHIMDTVTLKTTVPVINSNEDSVCYLWCVLGGKWGHNLEIGN